MPPIKSSITLTKFLGLLLGIFLSTLLIKKQLLYNLKIITLLEYKKLANQKAFLQKRINESKSKKLVGDYFENNKEKISLKFRDQISERQVGERQAQVQDLNSLVEALSDESSISLGAENDYHLRTDKNNLKTALDNPSSSTSDLSQKDIQNLKHLTTYKKGRILQNNEIAYRQLNSIYIGVLTCKKYLSTRAGSINATWGNLNYLTSDFSKRKIEYFAKIPNEEIKDYPNMNVNNLMHIDPDLDDKVYPPQQKAFSMLQHICENEIDQYKWYLRADDDVYVDVNGLEKLLDRIDSNRITYLGQPGMGWVEHRDKLGLAGHNFCMGGPGVLFSNALLKKICPFIDRCKVEVESLEEDVELGRCVLKYADVECTHSWEGIKRFHHAYDGTFKGTHPYSDNDLDENNEIKDSMTLHHIKVPWIMYKVHRFFLKRQLVLVENGCKSSTGDKNGAAAAISSSMTTDEFLNIYLAQNSNDAEYCPENNKILNFDKTNFYNSKSVYSPLSGPVLQELILVSEDIYDELIKSILEEEIDYLKKVTNMNVISKSTARKNLIVKSVSGFIFEKSFIGGSIGYVFDVEFERVNEGDIFSRRVYIRRAV